MYFDRDQNLRRQRQMAYRNELRQEIDMKSSKIVSKQQRSFNNQPQTFSLLKNIEIEQQNRKNKQSNYYAELRNQIELQKQQKKRKKQEQDRKEREEEEKIRKDHEMLKQRAEMEKMQQTRKKGIQQNNDFSRVVPDKKKGNAARMQQSDITPNQNQNKELKHRQQGQNQMQKNYYSRLKTSQSQKDNSQLPLQTFQSMQHHIQRKLGPYSASHLPTYMNRVQNQSFNFLPQRKYMDSYFNELLGQRKRFQQEVMGIYELNKIFYQQKARAGKIESSGLGELRKLQGLLNQKGANYMASYSNVKNYDQYDALKKFTAPSFEYSRLQQSGWRKLD